MAYGVKYRAYFDDVTNTRESLVEILEDGYASTVTELTCADNPIVINYNKSNYIIGSELVFRFVATQAETATYDEFLSSVYQNKKIKYYADGTNLTWVGWLLASNTDREFHPSDVVYSLSATDSLANLKDISYDSSGNPFNDTVSILTIIKRCINLGVIDDLDFFTQINTYETSLMTSSENPMIEVDVNNARFYTNKDGEISAMNAHDVLESVLKIFNCKLFQKAGYWYVVNDQEYNSFRTLYNWADLTVKTARAASNRSLDVNSYKPYDDKWTLSKIEPLKRIRIVFRDRGEGDNNITNGDFSSGTTGWNNVGFETFADGGGYLRTVQTDGNDNYFDRTSTFNIAAFDNGDFLTIRFKVKLVSATFPTTELYPAIVVKVVEPSGNVQDIFSYVQNVSGNWIELEAYYGILATGAYNIRFAIEPYVDDITNAEYHLDDIEIIQEPKDNTVFDGVYNYVNSANAYDALEDEVLFGDTLYDISIGSLTVAGTITETWNRYGKTDNERIIKLMARQIINDRGSFKDSFKLTIYDPSNNIDFGTVLLYNSKYYKWINYSKNYRFDNITGEVEQILNSDATITESIQSLTSTDGQTAQQIINNINITGQSYWVASGSNIYYSAGNVSIGVDSSDTKLYVVDDSATPVRFRRSSTDTTAAALVTTLNLDNPNTTTNNYSALSYTTRDSGGTIRNLAGIKGITTARAAGSVTGDLSFIVVAAGVTAEVMRMTSAGLIITLTASRALVTGASNQLAVSATTATEI